MWIAKTVFVVLLVPLLHGCFGGNPEPPATPAEGLAGPGPFELCTSTNDLDSEDYSSARLSYPCDLDKGPFPATTLTGGFTNTKEQMQWLAEHLASHGYVVLGMTPNNILGTPPVWESAHRAGIATLRRINSRAGSPLMNAINTDQLAITGFSMGGGGALLAGAELGNDIEALLPLAPWLGDQSPDYLRISAPTLVLGGSEDLLAAPAPVGSYFESLPARLTRGIALFRGANHDDWYGDSGDATQRNRFKTLVTAWLKRYLEDRPGFQSYFDGTEHDSHRAEDWFTRFAFQP